MVKIMFSVRTLISVISSVEPAHQAHILTVIVTFLEHITNRKSFHVKVTSGGNVQRKVSASDQTVYVLNETYISMKIPGVVLLTESFTHKLHRTVVQIEAKSGLNAVESIVMHY